MWPSTVATGAFYALLCAASIEIRQGCSSDYRICAPAGVTRTSLGPIGPDWSELFNSIINAISPASKTLQTVSDSSHDSAKRETGFCCSDTARCLAVDDGVGKIAMCWDRFTTNVFFPDGVYGTVVTGNFTTPEGDHVDLVYGDYTLKNGRKGNIYNAGNGTTTTSPNTATMPMPTPWTSSGVGSAIPATELGTTAELLTVTTIVPATTIEASTAGSVTMITSITGCDHCLPNNTTIPGPTHSGSTRSASTSIFTTGIIIPSIKGDSTKLMPLRFAASIGIALGAFHVF